MSMNPFIHLALALPILVVCGSLDAHKNAEHQGSHKPTRCWLSQSLDHVPVGEPLNSAIIEGG